MKSLIGELLAKAPIPIGGSSVNPLSTLAASSPVTKAIDAMGQVGTLFSIVNRNSNAVSQVEWKLYRKSTSRNTPRETRVEVKRHAALDLWNLPNPTTPRQQYVEGFEQHIELTGESWWVIGRNPASTMPLELWYVRPDRMSVAVGEEGVTGYVYRGPAGVKVPLEVDQVISLLMPNPNDRFRGMGPVQSILTELDSYRFTAEWNRNFFRNSAEPGGIIELDVTLSDTEFQQMRARWTEQHRGINNAHRVAIMEGGAKWVGNQITHHDMDFVSLREVSRDTIREAFGFPKPLLGASDNVNRANADAAETMYARWVQVPRLERIKSALNHQLLPLFGAVDLEFDYESPVPRSLDDERKDLQTASLAVARYVKAGYDPADALDALGLPPMRHIGLPE